MGSKERVEKQVLTKKLRYGNGFGPNHPWNRGLTKETDERVRGYAEEISRVQTGKSRGKGKKYSEIARWRMSEAAKRRWQRDHDKIVAAQNVGRSSPEYRMKRSSIALERSNRPERKALQAETCRRNSKKMVERRNASAVWRRSVTSDGYRRRQGEDSRIRWTHQEYKQKVIANANKAVHSHPNKKEDRLGKILEKLFPGEYKFTGDGSFILDGLNPDFLCVNGQKKIVELYGTYWHRNSNPQERIDRFKRFGFSTMIVWENDLDSPDLGVRLRLFHINNVDAVANNIRAVVGG